ncbi:uncharacterized protein LOC133832455 [Humulus lupulus]|uniref:uncharacterized protein LOC133832455 n=1 Tax=Humulus lupulus TaxID=3486 RepID=UPI002B40D693|nr:uncharacterized protein LOC133832455 [Humulus lupulus]
MEELRRNFEAENARIEQGHKRQVDSNAHQTEMFQTLLQRLPAAPANNQNEPEVVAAEVVHQDPPAGEARDEPQVEAPRVAQQKPISELFSRQNPPTFEGTTDPVVAEEWISILERIFDFRTTEHENVICTIYMLRKDARIWWDAVKKGHNVAEMEWPEFLVLFNSKYYSHTMIDHKVVEFTTLKQGNLSVKEYTRKFDHLCRFAPDLVNTESTKVWKYMRGLRGEIENLWTLGRQARKHMQKQWSERFAKSHGLNWKGRNPRSLKKESLPLAIRVRPKLTGMAPRECFSLGPTAIKGILEPDEAQG